MVRYVRDIDLGFKKIKKNTIMVGKAYVIVGALDNSKHIDKETKEVRPLAQVVATNEYGNPDKSIPARPFISTAMDDNRSLIESRVKKACIRIISREGDPAKEFDHLGAFHLHLVRQKILQIRNPPNASYTIEKKGHSKPLIDTWQMFNGIDYKVIM